MTSILTREEKGEDYVKTEAAWSKAATSQGRPAATEAGRGRGKTFSRSLGRNTGLSTR